MPITEPSLYKTAAYVLTRDQVESIERFALESSTENHPMSKSVAARIIIAAGLDQLLGDDELDDEEAS
jgi:hypothetical protein